MIDIDNAERLREVSLELLEFFQFRNIKVREGIGADGGRDIEAETIGRDESQADYLAKWWIELKFRSKKYLDIGNIEDKIRRAGNNHIQYFLLITNAYISVDILARLASRPSKPLDGQPGMYFSVRNSDST